ncbi:serine/threonine-protein kinase [Streptomyces sp. NBC_01408]|uniref:serine/threonine-protein kinase n=1 Tax=Streptomyces sp. NBC_01408 TaxID=2903855 RepID=UPI002250C686|nr:serine/threonine-protein kinase [Streptomyces sp. NBC_01408]MCX4695277.1 protein kinase [Streptomyces sp. NBC_01408]
MDTSEAGRRLIGGRFELVEPLGSGGMGTVWRARDIALDREVALKEVRPPDPATAAAQPGLAVQLRERAVREARALARLAHPHVVTIHHIVDPAAEGGTQGAGAAGAPGGPDAHPWIVMELVRGGSLHERLGSGPMPVAQVLRLGLEVLSALRAAHAEGVLHRDVKPANVLLRPDGGAVLTDFGIAALHGSAGLTSTGVLIGSPEYIAPERVRGEEGLAASDLWSLGMLLYVAAEGVHPLRRATSLATVVAVLDEPIPAPVRSGALGPVLERLLVRDPAARPDAAQLEQLLRNASSAPGGSTPPLTPPPALGQYGPPVHATLSPYPGPSMSPYAPTASVASDPGRRRSPAVLAAALAAVLTAGVIGIVQLLPDGTASKDGAKGSASGTPAASGTGPAPTGPPADAPGPGASEPAASGPATHKASVPQGGLLTPDGIRTALAALKQQTGTTTFVNLRIYEEYVIASVPTAPGAKTVDSWQYRGGEVTRTGPAGTVKDRAPLMDMAEVEWDALPALLEQSQRDLGVANPTSRYVIVEPWMMDQSPSVRPYLSDEYGQGGYVLAGTDGKVRKVYRS